VTGLNKAIVAANEAASGSGTITITLDNNISLDGTALVAINLQPGVTLDIQGGGFTLDSGNEQGGFVNE
jgi:hypothetical protein